MLQNKSGFTPQLEIKSLQQELGKNFGVGYLVYVEDTKKLLFQDATMKLHPIDKVSFLTNEWNMDNGSKNLPKPYVMNKNNIVKEYGDKVFYSFYGNNTDNIIVFGSLMKLNYPNYLESVKTDISNVESIQQKTLARNNEYRYFEVEEDGKGNVFIQLLGKEGEKKGKGNLRVRVEGAKNDGIIGLEVDGKIAISTIQREGENVKVINQIMLDSTKDKETITIKDKTNTITINKDAIKIESEKNIDIVVKEDAKVTAKNVNVEAQQKATIKSAKVLVTGGQLEVGGKASPNGQGGFCALPNCVFSGTPHTGNVMAGT